MLLRGGLSRSLVQTGYAELAAVVADAIGAGVDVVAGGAGVAAAAGSEAVGAGAGGAAAGRSDCAGRPTRGDSPLGPRTGESRNIRAARARHSGQGYSKRMEQAPEPGWDACRMALPFRWSVLNQWTVRNCSKSRCNFAIKRERAGCTYRSAERVRCLY